MDIFSANMDPVADAIKGIGTGFVNNALKKVEIDRQLGKDIYDAAKTEAAINWDRARTRNQNLKTDNLQTLSARFNPESFNQKERAALGASAMLGSTSYNDAMKGVGTQQITGFRADRYAHGSPVEKLSLALGNEVNPYRYDSRTGVVYNTMDGTVNIDPNVVNNAVEVGAKLGEKGGGRTSTPRIASPSELVTVFSDVIEEKDAFGNTVRRTVRNDKALNEFIAFAHQNGIPRTHENAWLYKAGVLVGDMANRGVQASAPVQAPGASPALAMGEKTSAVVHSLPAEVQNYVRALIEDYEDGNLNDIELQQLLQETGYFK